MFFFALCRLSPKSVEEGGWDAGSVPSTEWIAKIRLTTGQSASSPSLLQCKSEEPSLSASPRLVQWLPSERRSFVVSNIGEGIGERSGVDPLSCSFSVQSVEKCQLDRDAIVGAISSSSASVLPASGIRVVCASDPCHAATVKCIESHCEVSACSPSSSPIEGRGTMDCLVWVKKQIERTITKQSRKHKLQPIITIHRCNVFRKRAVRE
ncbi:hypothetical protein BLNAU_9097 [Blattamonas nauphoetae]|uniref:Uncharacterized protein n=1 Tax=Blattamonas nauphoetae TaxID=2049346 RepID=A0ABQ9XWR9_9EUKA|nr:hypothetical protein BLNAU_9097 [Blattamonas nauphoetae]